MWYVAFKCRDLLAGACKCWANLVPMVSHLTAPWGYGAVRCETLGTKLMLGQQCWDVLRWDVAIVWPGLKVIINNSISVIHQVLQDTKEHQAHSCSVLSTQVVCQQRCLWLLETKDMLSIAAMAMGLSLEVAMIFMFPVHQIPTTAAQIWTTRTSAQQVRMLTHFWQEIKTFVLMKWKFLDLSSKKLILCDWTEKWFASDHNSVSFFNSWSVYCLTCYIGLVRCHVEWFIKRLWNNFIVSSVKRHKR